MKISVGKKYRVIFSTPNEVDRVGVLILSEYTDKYLKFDLYPKIIPLDNVKALYETKEDEEIFYPRFYTLLLVAATISMAGRENRII